MAGGLAGLLWRGALALLAAGALGAAAEEPAPRGAFAVEAAVLLAEAGQRGAEAGYVLRATLRVAPVARDPGRLLLRFELEEPTLLLRGPGARAEWRPRGPAWPAAELAPFFLVRAEGEPDTAGLALAAHAGPAASPHLRNFLRALLGLFQYRPVAGERVETDASGECRALYEADEPLALRKSKSGCRWAGEADGAAGTRARRVTRYTLGAGGAPVAVHAEEVLEAGEPAGAAVKARSWLRLQLQPAGPPPSAPVPQVTDVLAALPPGLAPLPLPLEPTPFEPEPEEEVAAALAAGEAALGGDEAGRGGSAREAAALLALLPRLRRAKAGELRAALREEARGPRLPALLRLLALAGTTAAHRAASELLQPRNEPAGAAARAYLAALALAPAVAAPVARDALQLGLGGAGDPALAPAALLAAAACAPAAGLAADAAAQITAQLARCEDDECRETRLHALGNLRLANTSATLLEHAGGPRGPALAALRALHAAPPEATPPVARKRLLAVALDAPPLAPREAPRPLEQRAAALELAARRSRALPSQLAPALRALHESGASPAAAELRRLLRQLLGRLAAGPGPARELLAAVARDPQLGSWAARAAAGTSASLEAPAGWAVGGWRAALRSTSVAAAGLLRRGDLALLVQDPAGAERELLSVELWTRGLQALAGAADPADPSDPADPEPVAGGLVLRVAGALLPPLALFEGQAELLSHVWAGTGSSPEPVVRALLPLAEGQATRPLLAGAVVRLSHAAAASLALDAFGRASLWSRTAQAGLLLRAACAAEARALVRSAWGPLEVRVAAASEPRLRLAADLDFYDRPALCVRVHVHDRADSRNTTLSWELGPRRLRALRRRSELLPAPGLTPALAREAHAACLALPPQDDDAR